MSQSPANLLTVKETAEYLRIPVPTVYYLVQRGQLPAIQIGGRWRIKKDPLDKEILKLEDAGAEPDASQSLAAKTGEKKILIVDDQQNVSDLLTMTFSNQGYTPDTAASGTEALNKLQSNEYDLVFLDLNLPDMAGEDIFEKAIEINPKIHVVIMTGFSTVESLERILGCGPVTVLQKPFKLEKLLHVTEVLLGKSETAEEK
ncbi:MAG: response regulator [Verrucomicrobiota bacterium]